jgi:hypothetical protein
VTVEEPSSAPSSPPLIPPPPPWLRNLVILMSLVWGSAEVFVLGARAASFAFILAVLFGTVGVDVAAKAKGLLR